ncbi:ligase-associated DNA damage response exonuclease [Alphaproteobacteria bacterium]|nr:ligase-associated DNA damage response exonuclease [Alphaproteobacteria bacterium]
MSIISHNLYIKALNAYIDPIKPADKAIITHAHADHAKPNHNSVLATEDTINIMKIRYGESCANKFQTIAYGEKININGVTITFYPAGHILGSAQVLLEDKKNQVLITGDYKTVEDDTAQSFELIKTETLITEATFGLPIFKHPNPDKEIEKLLNSLEVFSKKCHIIGAYALGKSQRVISLLRKKGYDDVIYLHGAIEKITDYYLSRNIKLGKLKKVTKDDVNNLKGKIIIAPPSAIKDKWVRKFKNVRYCLASGWMIIKQRVKQSKIELPLVISDHADWNELTGTILSSNAKKVLITHGRADALKYWCKLKKINAESLNYRGDN